MIAAVQKLFDAMQARDPAAARAVLLDEGRYFSVAEKDGQPVIGGMSHPQFADRLGASKEPIREVMHGPKVMVRGRIATLWTPYEFFRNGKRSHCGADSFHLIKTSDGWKIAGFIYTVEPSGCPVR